MEATLTLPQAGELLGVEDGDLSRLIRIGALPEARKVDRPEGRVWTIDKAHLPAIASRNGWTIDLRDGAEEQLTVEPSEAQDTPAATPSAMAMPTAIPAPTAAPAPSAPSAVPTPAAVPAPAVPTTPAAVPAPMIISAPAAVPTPTIKPTPNGQPEPAASPEPFDVALVPRDEALPAAPASDEDGVVAKDGLVAKDGAVVEVELASDPNDEQDGLSGRNADLALLDRLLASHENRVAAQIREQEARMALSTLADTHNKTTGELDVERRERMAVAERYREERRARAEADAKVAELRDRVAREMALAESEKEARSEALNRGLRAERDAANAVALLGWRARRRYRKLSETSS